MKPWVLRIWEPLRTSYWFVPTLMTAAAIALAVGAMRVDQQLDGEAIDKLGWTYAGGPEGARAVLSTIAASMMTVAGVVFSITIVALTLASQQFGPRLLRNFMRDTGNQVVLGTFLATFVYCLLVLRTVRGVDGAQFVPHVSVTIAVALGIVSLGVLIYFIHHVSLSIQASHVIGTVAKELHAAIDRIFPERLGREPEPMRPQLPADLDSASRALHAAGSGYLQAIDAADLLSAASECGTIVRLRCRPGDFVLDGAAVADVWPGDRLDERLTHRLRQAFLVGSQRTEAQDADFVVRQMVDIAVRALSPSMNDPFTAITCIDRLTDGLRTLADRAIPSPYRLDDHGQLRVVAPPTTFPMLAGAAFVEIARHARASASVTMRLLEGIGRLAAFLRREEDAAALREIADEILEGSMDAPITETDRAQVRQRYDTAVRSLTSAGGVA